MMSITFGDTDTELMKIRGCQPSLCTARYARIAYCGVTFSTRTFAPEACSVDIWDSIVVSVGSYAWPETISDFFEPRPFFRPSVRSLPNAESSNRTPTFALGIELAMYRP